MMKRIFPLLFLLLISTIIYGQTLIRLSQIEPIQGTVIKSQGEPSGKVLTTNGTNGTLWQTPIIYAPTSGSANYIQNQNASAQTANMWISGTITGNNIISTRPSQINQYTDGLRIDRSTGANNFTLINTFGGGSTIYAADIASANGGTFRVVTGDGSTTYNERFRITPVGNMLINTTSDNTTDKLQVNGSILGSVIKSNIAQGTAPLTVASTTLVSNLNAEFLNGLSSLFYTRGHRQYYNSVVGDDGTDGWYTLFQLQDSGNSPVQCFIRAYAHTSLLFTVSKGYSAATPNITILNANTASLNGAYKYIKGVRLLSDGNVQIKLNGGANVSIQAQVVDNGYGVTLASTLTKETGTPTITDVIDPIVDRSIRTNGQFYAGSSLVYNADNSNLTSVNWSSNVNNSLQYNLNGANINTVGTLTNVTYKGALANNAIPKYDGTQLINSTWTADANGKLAYTGSKTYLYIGPYAGASDIQQFESSYNTGVGSYALNFSATARYNSAFGGNALLKANGTTAWYNNAFGYGSLQSSTTGGSNSAFGYLALASSTTGSNNVAFGNSAGRYYATNTNMTLANNSTFIGFNTRASANNNTNEIVIGYDAVGNGSNTIQLGNTSITTVKTSGSYNASGFLLNGTNINTAGTLTNVAYKGTLTTNYIPKYGVNQLENSQIFDNGTNVGIGTTSPGEKLEVAGKTKTTTFQMTTGATDGYYMKSDASGNGTWAEIEAGENNSTQTLSGTAITFNVSNGKNAGLTLSGATTITLSNLVDGMEGSIFVTNANSTSFRITFAGYPVYIYPSVWYSGDECVVSGGTAKDIYSYKYIAGVLAINGALGLK